VVGNLVSPGVRYLGWDPAAAALVGAWARFPTRTFTGTLPVAFWDATLSLDVLFHLVDDAAFAAYLELLFGRARRVALVYGTDEERAGSAPHVRHRRWTEAIPAGWRVESLERTRFKSFWVLVRVPA
jgi:hypothetical protein